MPAVDVVSTGSGGLFFWGTATGSGSSSNGGIALGTPPTTVVARSGGGIWFTGSAVEA